MTHTDKDAFIESAIETVTETLESGQKYEWLYVSGEPTIEISLANISECAAFYLDDEGLAAHLKALAIEPTTEKAKAFRDWFVEDMANYVALEEWLACSNG